MNADTLDLDTIDTDAPLFDPGTFGLGDKEAGLNALARRLGRSRFAPRAAAYDRDARVPTENYTDLGDNGLLGICIPKAQGWLGAGFRAYCTTAAEIGRYCAATALTWNMHTCTCPWTGPLADDLGMARDDRELHLRRRALHYRRVISDGALYAQPFSEGGVYDGMTRMTPFSTVATRVAGGWRINRRKIFASLAGAADYYGILWGEAGQGEPGKGEPPSRRNAMYLAVPADAPGVEVAGDWNPLGMRGTVSRTILFKDVLVDAAALVPRGLFFQAATRWRHMFLLLSPTYSRHRPGSLRLHRPLSARRDHRPEQRNWRREAQVTRQAARGGPDVHHAAADEGAVVPGDVRGRRCAPVAAGPC